MKTFTIDAENNITVHAAKKAAKETGLPSFASAEQFAEIIGTDNRRLVEIFNSLPGIKPVTKFANRKAGAADLESHPDAWRERGIRNRSGGRGAA